MCEEQSWMDLSEIAAMNPELYEVVPACVLVHIAVCASLWLGVRRRLRAQLVEDRRTCSDLRRN